jgi:hypothetical protein
VQNRRVDEIIGIQIRCLTVERPVIHLPTDRAGGVGSAIARIGAV